MISRIRARLREAKADDRGFTLIEVMVAMSLGLVVLGGTMTLMSTVEHFQRQDSVRTNDTQDASGAVQSITKFLHSTTAICTTTQEALCTKVFAPADTSKGELISTATNPATYNSLWFYSNFDDSVPFIPTVGTTPGIGKVDTKNATHIGPYRVHIYVNASGVMRADLYRPVATSALVCCTWPTTATTSLILAQNVKVTAPSGAVVGVPFSYKSSDTTLLTSPLSSAASTGIGAVDRVLVDITVSSGKGIPGTEIQDVVLLPNQAHDSGDWGNL